MSILFDLIWCHLRDGEMKGGTQEDADGPLAPDRNENIWVTTNLLKNESASQILVVSESYWSKIIK